MSSPTSTAPHKRPRSHSSQSSSSSSSSSSLVSTPVHELVNPWAAVLALQADGLGAAGSGSSLLSGEMEQLVQKKIRLEKQLSALEKQIYALETSYLTNNQFGNLLKGWDSLATRGAAARLQPPSGSAARLKESDRLFSLSSVSSDAQASHEDILAAFPNLSPDLFAPPSSSSSSSSAAPASTPLRIDGGQKKTGGRKSGQKSGGDSLLAGTETPPKDSSVVSVVHLDNGPRKSSVRPSKKKSQA